MIKKFIIFIALLFVPFLFPGHIFADNEFATTSDIHYDVSDDGITTVTENISLQNLTDRYYPSSFSLLIGPASITDVSAHDQFGPLNAQTNQAGNKVRITVNFSQQLAGQGKLYKWTLTYHTKDFAQKLGKVWQVSIPRINLVDSQETYHVSLSVPDDFGTPTSIRPQPDTTGTTNGRLSFEYSQKQLSSGGIIASFGDNQVFSYTLTYHVHNSSILPTVENISLPPDTAYQQVIINTITPKPDNVITDQDGNYLAEIPVGSKQDVTVTVKGLAKLYLNPYLKLPALSQTDSTRLTAQQLYWETDNPAITSKLADILQGKESLPTKDKVALIYKYVVGALQYDQDRVKKNDYTRLGAVTVLNNPTQALCSEFTDLFVTLVRAAGIPARSLTGYAYTSNTDLRPLSLQNNLLHAWPEYYDKDAGWVMVDPTWENTTGGIDYFNKTDMNHFVFYQEGSTSTNRQIPDQIQVGFSDNPFQGGPKTEVSIISSKDLYAAFPAQAVVHIANVGDMSQSSVPFSFSAQELGIGGETNFVTPEIPPFGYVEYPFPLYTASLWSSFNDTLMVKLGDQQFIKPVSVKPFFTFSNYTIGVILCILIILGTYIFTIVLHVKQPKIMKKIHIPSSENKE